MAQDNNQNKIPGFNKKGEAGGDDKSKRPKFSIYWVYGIVALLLVGYQLLRGVAPTATVITDLKFRDEMLASNDIQKLELVRNKDVVRVYIEKDSLNKDLYRKLLGDKWALIAKTDGPHFQFEVPDAKTYLGTTLTEFYKEHKNVREVPVNIVSDPEWFGSLLSYIFPLLMFALLFVLMMRKVGGPGGGGGPGGIFSIGKSKATLFEKGTKVNITFADVAGLEEAKQEVMEIVKNYDNGEMDIRARGTSVFRMLEIIKIIPEKLYSGAIVNYPDNNTNGNHQLMKKVLTGLKEMHALLNVTKNFLKPDHDLSAYDIAHHCSLSFEEEYELLGLMEETQRQEYLKRHISKIIPMLNETEALKEKIKLNGHFKNLSSFDIDFDKEK